MRHIANRVWLLAFAVIVVCCAAVYVHQTYFFNPLTFRNNNVLYLPFNLYKNPMQIQVWGQLGTSKQSVIYTTFDRTQINFVLKQLESGQNVDSSEFNNTDPTSGFAHITIRTGASRTSPIVQDAFMIGRSFDIAQIGTQVPGHAFQQYITISPALRAWVMNAFNKGKPIN